MEQSEIGKRIIDYLERNTNGERLQCTGVEVIGYLIGEFKISVTEALNAFAALNLEGVVRLSFDEDNHPVVMLVSRISDIKNQRKNLSLEGYKKMLKRCVENEEYDKAALLRDKIKELEGNNL